MSTKDKSADLTRLVNITMMLATVSSVYPHGATGSVRVGTFDRDLESGGRNDDSGFHWEVDLLWEPRTYTHLKLLTRRISTETNGVGNYTDTREYTASCSR